MAQSNIDLTNLVIVSESAAIETGPKDILGGPGRLYALFIDNQKAGILHLNVYDAVNPTVGSDGFEYQLMLKASTQRFIPFNPNGTTPGVEFTNGISLACHITAGSDDATAPSGTVVVTAICKRT